MATADKIGEAVIELRAASDKLAAELRKVESDSRTSAGKIEKTFSQTKLTMNTGPLKTGLNDIAAGFSKVFAAIGGMYALKRVAEFIGDIAYQAAKVEEMRSAFQGTTQDVEAFRKATSNTVTDANLIALSNQATDLGISLKDQPLLFGLAERAADAYGTGVEGGFQKVVMATEGSAKALKTIGIQKGDYEHIVKELARAHGGLITEMDAETQKQIRLEAVIRASGITFDEVNNKVMSNADKIESLGVAWENLKEKVGSFVAPTLADAVDGLTNFLNIAQQSVDTSNLESIQKRLEEINKELASGKPIYGFWTKIGMAMGVLGNPVGGYLASKLDSPEMQDKRRKGLEAERNQLKAENEKLMRSLLYPDIVYPDGSSAAGGGLSEEAQMKRAKDLAEARAKLDAALSEFRISQIDNEYKKKLETIAAEYEKEKSLLEARAKAENLPKKTYQGELDTLWMSATNKRNEAEKQYSEQRKKETESIAQLASEANIAGIQDAYDRERAAIREAARQKLEQYSIENAKKLGMDAEYALARKAIEEKLQTDLANLQREQDEKVFRGRLSAVSELSNSLAEAFNKSGENFISKLNQALQVVFRIVDAVNTAGKPGTDSATGTMGIINSILGFATLFGAANGGRFIGMPGGIRKMAGGGSFTVPGGFPNDSFPLMVQSGERVSVTPSIDVSVENAALASRLDALNANIVNLMVRSRSEKIRGDFRVRGEIDNQTIRLANRSGERSAKLITG